MEEYPVGSYPEPHEIKVLYRTVVGTQGSSYQMPTCIVMDGKALCIPEASSTVKSSRNGITTFDVEFFARSVTWEPDPNFEEAE